MPATNGPCGTWVLYTLEAENFNGPGSIPAGPERTTAINKRAKSG